MTQSGRSQFNLRAEDVSLRSYTRTLIGHHMNKRGKVAGEFVLIIVGVFIALMLESMMSERNDGELRTEYLSRIRADIVTDKQTFEYRIGFFTAVQQFSQDLLDWMHTDAPVDQSVLLAAFYAAEVWPAVPNISTYQDLQSTGNFRLIENIDLRTSLFQYYNKADTSRPGWNPSDEYRKIIRGIIPSEVQAQIREACPTADSADVVPTGFPPCDLQNVDLERMTALFAPLRSDTAFQRILTYRHSELGVMLRLFRQQVAFADNVLANIED